MDKELRNAKIAQGMRTAFEDRAIQKQKLCPSKNSMDNFNASWKTSWELKRLEKQGKDSFPDILSPRGACACL